MTAIGYIIRVANYVDASGAEILWTTRVTPAPSGTVRPYLDTAPMISGASIAPLDAVASSGGMNWTMTVPTGSTDAQPLLRRDLSYPGGSIVRLAAYVDAADTSVTLDTTGLTTPQIVYAAGETLRLTSETSPGVYAVDRALGSLGVAREMRWVYQQDPPPLVLTRPTDPRGMRVSVHLWDGSTETLVYRGVLRDCTRTDHGAAFDIVSSIGWVRERAQAPKLVVSADGGPFAQAVVDFGERRLAMYALLRDSWIPTVARIWFGDAWVVTPVDTGIEGPLGDDAAWSIGEQPILQWGAGAYAWPQSTPPPGLAETGTPSKIESLWSVGIDTPAATLQAMLVAQWPPGQVGGLAANDIADLTAIDEVFGEGDLLCPYADGARWWPLPTKDAKSITDAVSAGLLQPMQCALTAGTDGRLVAIDWLRSLGPSETVVDAELMLGLGATGDIQPLRSAQWSSMGPGGETSVTYLSDLVSQIAGGGKDLSATPGWLQAVTWLGDRTSMMLQLYQLSTPTVTIQVTRAKAAAMGLQPGLVIGLTCGTLWNRLGLRGVSNISALVVSVSRRLHERAGVYDALLLLSGYSIPLTLGNWGPSGVVVSVGGSTVTLTMDNGDDVDDWFTAGVAVALTDPTGLVLDGTVSVTASTSTSITVSGLGVTPAPGDRIEVAAVTVAAYPDTAYLSNGQQYV